MPEISFGIDLPSPCNSKAAYDFVNTRATTTGDDRRAVLAGLKKILRRGPADSNAGSRSPRASTLETFESESSRRSYLRPKRICPFVHLSPMSLYGIRSPKGRGRDYTTDSAEKTSLYQHWKNRISATKKRPSKCPQSPALLILASITRLVVLRNQV